MVQIKNNNDWRYIAQIDLGDFLTLTDVKIAYLQNYLDQGYVDVGFEPVGSKRYKVYLYRPQFLKKLNNKDPRFQLAILPIKIKLLESQMKNFPNKKQEIKNEIAFWQIALKNHRAKRKLAEWEVGLPDKLRLKLRDRKYLPTFKEANKIPFKQREAYQLEFFDYEIWNQEYLKVLAKEIGQKKVVLEVGAGNGRLSYFLRQFNQDCQIISTDISLKHEVTGIPLIKMSMKQALQQFKPDILLCAWPDAFFWQEIKYNTGAKKIILIGDAEDTPLSKEIKGDWQWLPIKGFKMKECLACQKVQTSRDSLGTTLIYTQ